MPGTRRHAIRVRRVVGGQQQPEHAVGEDVRSIRQSDGPLGALLDEEDRKAAVTDRLERREDEVDDGRRQPQGRLVQEQHRRLRHQGASDRELLLLAARERARGPLAELLEDGKERVDVGQIAAPLGASSPACESEPQVLLHGQLPKQPSPFRDERDAGAGDRLRTAAAQ